MSFKESLVQMMGDFVNMNKTPEFRSKNDLSTSPELNSLTVPNATRRQSLNITVGTQGPPESLIYHRHSVCPELMRVPRSTSRSKSPIRRPEEETPTSTSRRQTEPAITLTEIRQKFRHRRNPSGSDKSAAEREERTEERAPKERHQVRN